MKNLTTMSLLMYPIRHEFYKTTNLEVIEILSDFSAENISKLFHKFEGVKLNFDELKEKIPNIPIHTAKTLLRLSREPSIRELIEAYMLSYELYNLNILLRARLNGNTDKNLFLFDYSAVTSKAELLKLEKIDEIKKVYFKVLTFYKIKSKKLRDTLRIVSVDNINELLLYSSIEYYRSLVSKGANFGHSLENILKTKAFYELLLTLAKIKFLANANVEKYISDLSFLGGKQELLANIFVSTKESFVKKCIDYDILPPNFILTDIDDIDRLKNTLLKLECKRLIIGTPMDPATIIGIIILREIDMKNYFSILGGFVSGFPFEKVRQLLVL
ncbi:MAG: V-type ATPase subunit [Brevinematia bacterium]